MKKPDQGLAQLYQIPGYQKPDPNTIQEAVSSYIEEYITTPLGAKYNSSTPAIVMEAETVAYSVAGFAYNAGHEAGWNEAINFIQHLTEEFVTEPNPYDTFIDSSGELKKIVRS